MMSDEERLNKEAKILFEEFCNVQNQKIDELRNKYTRTDCLYIRNVAVAHLFSGAIAGTIHMVGKIDKEEVLADTFSNLRETIDAFLEEIEKSENSLKINENVEGAESAKS
jgi:hypothetical protein